MCSAQSVLTLFRFSLRASQMANWWIRPHASMWDRMGVSWFFQCFSQHRAKYRKREQCAQLFFPKLIPFASRMRRTNGMALGSIQLNCTKNQTHLFFFVVITSGLTCCFSFSARLSVWQFLFWECGSQRVDVIY